MAKPKSRPKPRPDVPLTTSPQLRTSGMRGDGGTGSLPVRQYSGDMSDGSFSSFESASFPGNSSALYSSHPPPSSISHSDVQQHTESSYFVRPGKLIITAIVHCYTFTVHVMMYNTIIYNYNILMYNTIIL